MTGFAVASCEVPGGTLGVEIRTVNHRYLDLTLRLPDEIRGLEPALRERFGAELKRGKVDCRVGFARGAGQAAALTLDTAALERLEDVASEVMRHLPGSAPLTVNEILRWPGVLIDASLSAETVITSRLRPAGICTSKDPSAGATAAAACSCTRAPFQYTATALRVVTWH